MFSGELARKKRTPARSRQLSSSALHYSQLWRGTAPFVVSLLTATTRILSRLHRPRHKSGSLRSTLNEGWTHKEREALAMLMHCVRNNMPLNVTSAGFLRPVVIVSDASGLKDGGFGLFVVDGDSLFIVLYKWTEQDRRWLRSAASAEVELFALVKSADAGLLERFARGRCVLHLRDNTAAVLAASKRRSSQSRSMHDMFFRFAARCVRIRCDVVHAWLPRTAWLVEIADAASRFGAGSAAAGGV